MSFHVVRENYQNLVVKINHHCQRFYELSFKQMDIRWSL